MTNAQIRRHLTYLGAAVAEGDKKRAHWHWARLFNYFQLLGKL